MAFIEPEMLWAITGFVMAITFATVLVIAAWKGRGFIAQWKDIKLTLNPHKLNEVTRKLDEVVTSVQNTSHVHGNMNLMERAQVLEDNQDDFRHDIETIKQTIDNLVMSQRKVELRSASMDSKLSLLIRELKSQVGLQLEKEETDG